MAGSCDVWRREGVLLMDSEASERGVVRRHERGESPTGAGVRVHSVGQRGREAPGSAAGVQRRRRRQQPDPGNATVWSDGRRRAQTEPVHARGHALGSTRDHAVGSIREPKLDSTGTGEERRLRGPEHHASPFVAHCLRPVIYASEHRLTHRRGLITVVHLSIF